MKSASAFLPSSSLIKRDAAAPDIGGVLTLSRARTDDPLAGLPSPKAAPGGPIGDRPSHLQNVQAHDVSRVPAKGEEKGIENHENAVPQFKTGREADRYIRKRYRLIRGGKAPGPARKKGKKGKG